MNDDFFGAVVFCAIAVGALASAVQLIQTEVQPERARASVPVAVASAPPAPAMQPLPSEPTGAASAVAAQPETITLPRVVVNGKRTPPQEWIAGTPKDVGAVAGMNGS